MSGIRPLIAALLLAALFGQALAAVPQRQQQRRQPTPADRRAATTPVGQSLLTGIYRLDPSGSDDPRIAAARAASGLPAEEQRRVVDSLAARLESPEQLAIERRGRMIEIASSRAPRISFEADGREHEERAADGHRVSTRAVLYGDQLMVSTSGSPDDEFTVTFDPLDQGRRLRVTRRIYIEQIREPVVVQSLYNKTSSVARWGIFNESRQTARAAGGSTQRRAPAPSASPGTAPGRQQPAPPVIRERTPQTQGPPANARRSDGANVYGPEIPTGTRLVAVLERDLSTAQSREGDTFTMTVRGPAQYEGATLEGYIARIDRGGTLTGRAEMTLEFRQIRLRDGRTAPFTGYIENVKAAGGEDVRLGSENTGSIEESDDQTQRTTERTAIGAAVGAIIGAIADGGKGAAIGAAIGAGIGAGSVYAQGRDDLELLRGTELTIRAGGLR